MSQRFLTILFLVLFLFPLCATPTTDQERCKGAYLRSESHVVSTEKTIACDLALLPNSMQPTLRLRCRALDTLQEIKIYELRVRKFVLKDGQVGGKYEYHTIPNEVWKDPPTTTIRQRIVGLLSNTVISINGITATTDSNGYIPFNEIQMLEKFDRLDGRTAVFTITSRGYKPVSFTVHRTIPQRQIHDEKLIDEPIANELLSVYNLNYRQSIKEPERNGLTFSLELPQDLHILKCGQMIPVKVIVENHGTKATSCLIGRSFSRIPGMNGRFFYFGAIPADSRASFVRYLFVNPENLTNEALAEIRFSDSWGSFKESLEIRLPVVH